MSNNERHTPSPWRWNDTYAARAGDQTMSLIGDDGHGILSCDGLENSPQRPADAALIAAAPDLLEALKNALGVLFEEDLGNRWGHIIDPISSLIARAEGREP